MIRVDESDPVGEPEPSFPYNDVTIKRGIDAKEFYEVIEEIGRGKFGTVYKCREKSTGQQFAAKFIPIPKREDRRNVEREVEIMNSLQHSKIIQLYDAYEFSKNMWVILELVEGGELFDRVIDDNFLLTEKACTVIVRQVCEAMEFVHRNFILHLDLKPENILCLTREGNRIKLIDFGLARRYDPDKKLQVLFGTPEFVAPEVVNFDLISFGTDMWSVGVICYVLLSGLSPFMGETDIETMTNVTISKYDFDDEAFNDVSAEALDFISRLMVKDINARMTASQCLEHTWLKRKYSRPQLAPKPVTIPPPKFKSIPTTPIENGFSDIAEEEELGRTKENLKEFVERWTDHPNSPYIFDCDSKYLAPVQIDVNGNSNSNNLSSRGCSPSPCESLSSSTNDHDNNVISTDTNNSLLISPNENCISDNQHHLTNNNNYNNNNNNSNVSLKNNNQNDFMVNGNENIRVDVNDDDEEKEQNNKNIKDYLQTFDRRNSDSKFMIKDNPNIVEKINLADEIQKLSERLLMLSKMNVEIGGGNQNQDPPVTTPQPVTNGDIPELKTNGFGIELDLKKSNSSKESILNALNEIQVEKPEVKSKVEKPIPEIVPRKIEPEPPSKPKVPSNRPERVLSPINECFNRAISLTPSSSSSLTNGISVINNIDTTTSTTNNINNDTSSVSNESLCSSDDKSTVNILDSISKSITKSSLKLDTHDKLEEQNLANLSTESKYLRVKSAPSTFSRQSSFEKRILDEHQNFFNHDSFNDDRRSYMQTSRRNSFFAQTINGMNTNGTSSSSTNGTTTTTMFKSTMSTASGASNNRRTKFRINELSRDVPLPFIRNNSGHNRNGFVLENSSATETKDCLLQLLEKYHDNNMRTIRRSSINSGTGFNGFGRHQSISVDWGLSDNLESRSMNSINAFFHRHSSHGNAVKQIQAQIEGRNHH